MVTGDRITRAISGYKLRDRENLSLAGAMDNFLHAWIWERIGWSKQLGRIYVQR